ncbi:MAG: gliding motility-associated C-terminal domain-containing protein [Cyclobacteriaceae bacterium]|nr:gliding motility-associated C-terminal domain-containing protein [Cyclobacteriaceae bacterium]
MRIATFVLFIVVTFAANAQVINRAEYFVDVDPGPGNGTSITVASPAASVNLNFTIPTTSLAPGFHVLGFRSRSSSTGFWSHVMHQAFYIIPPLTTIPATTLTRAEYFFDADPGNGNGINLPITAAVSVSQSFAVPLGSLAAGFHTLHVRMRDNTSRWSLVHAQTFYIVPPVVVPGTIELMHAEYFFDTDPGQGNGTAIPIVAGSNQVNAFAIPLTGLSAGFHTIKIRYKSNSIPASWSHGFQGQFYILPTPPLQAQKITRIEYFIDTDPGYGAASTVSFTPAPVVDHPVAIDLTGVASGNHILGVRVKDDKGYWSDITTSLFTVSNCTPPPSPAATNQARCNPGTLTLTASGSTGTQVYRWYNDPILNDLVFTGSVFVTPPLTTTRNYYVSILDPTTSCESARVAVTATVTIIAKPTINPTGNISFCEGSFVFLSAPAGFNTYLWSGGETTQQILVAASGSYSVQTGNGTCLSEMSDAVVVTVIDAPDKPIVTALGSTTICGTGSVELTGPAGFQYQWSNGATTQAITVSQTGFYSLIVKTTGASCPSYASDPVVVTVLTPPCTTVPNNQPPVINSAPLASQIEGVLQIDLTELVTDADNNIDFNSLAVINNQTARGVAAFIDASYFLQVDYSGNAFTGVDRITLQVCDLAGACTQQVIDINVVGEVVVFNGITPDGNGINDSFYIKYIDVIEGAAQNKVSIYNRWGDLVFETENYDNVSRVFTGQTNTGKDLPSGTYYYKIEFMLGQTKTGFITLKR